MACWCRTEDPLMLIYSANKNKSCLSMTKQLEGAISTPTSQQGGFSASKCKGFVRQMTSRSLFGLNSQTIIIKGMKILIVVLCVAFAGCELYSLSREFQVSGKVVADELAHATYENLLQKTGWNRLYIYTNANASPLQQHQAAGFLEGYATYRQIWNAFNNLINMDFLGSPNAPPVIENFLEQQVNYMDLMADINRDDPFWTYIGHYLAQVRYMHAGYLARIKRERLPQMKLEFQQFYYLTSAGDLEDLISLDTGEISDKKNCDIYIRLQGKMLYYSHHTHDPFTETLRIFKTWSFPRDGVPMQTTSFTSRPGDLISKDDFILLSSGLGVFETSLQNYVKANYDDLRISTAPSWIRTVVANHLSHTPDQWIGYFNTSRSGTHNNQWFIVDPSALQKGSQAVVVFEEGFTVSARIDMTSQLLQKGYVASYNMPITQQVYKKLGYMFIGPETYQTDERAIAFRTLHPKMKTIDDMKYYLMNNDNQDSYCHGIAPRCDLDDKGYPFGVLDCKIGTLDTINRNFIWAISGPTTSNGRFPPFDWRQWNNYPHQGLPTVYNFDWQAIAIDIEKPVRTNPSLLTEG